ncbi:MAG: putative sulfate exporter family transporter, partial [Paludibacter sp.]
SFLSTFLFKNKNSKVKIPYFIGLFVVAMVLDTYVPFVKEFSGYIVTVAKAGLTLTLFLIGSGLSKKVLQSVGVKPLIQGVILWIIISTTSLWIITSFVSQ